MADEMIGMTMPLDMTIETDAKCSDFRISLVLDPKLVKLLGKKDKDFKSFVFEGKKFEFDEDEGPLGDEYGDEGDEGDDSWFEDGEGETDDDFYRRRLQYEDYFVERFTDTGFYTSEILNGEVGFSRNSLGPDYTNDKYEKEGSESYYVSDTGENYYKEFKYTYTNYDASKALNA